MTTIALNVPRARKDEAKALGARWNGFKKTWYVKVGTDLSPFKALGFYDVAEPAAPVAPVATTGSSTDATTAAAASVRKIPLTKAEFMNRPMSFEYEAGSCGDELRITDPDYGVFRYAVNGGYFFKSTVTGEKGYLPTTGYTVTALSKEMDDAWLEQVMLWKPDFTSTIAAVFANHAEGTGITEVTFEGIEFADESPTA